jgi:hypothetical protein
MRKEVMQEIRIAFEGKGLQVFRKSRMYFWGEAD